MESKNIFRLLQIATIALLLGRGWQFMVKGNMFNDFLGHPTFMNPVVKYIYQTDWKEYLTNPVWGIFFVININGCFYKKNTVSFYKN